MLAFRSATSPIRAVAALDIALPACAGIGPTGPAEATDPAVREAAARRAAVRP